MVDEKKKEEIDLLVLLFLFFFHEVNILLFVLSFRCWCCLFRPKICAAAVVMMKKEDEENAKSDACSLQDARKKAGVNLLNDSDFVTNPIMPRHNHASSEFRRV